MKKKKLVKFLKRIEQELKERKEKFADYNVASLAQYEQKSGEKLPISLTIFDGFDSLKDHPLEETIEVLINRILREGSSLGFYVILTALRSNSLKISMSSNISSRIVLFMVDETAANEIIGREALIQQEILGRGQIKEEAVHAIQIYLPTDGNTDIERLTHLESEIKVISQMWTGKRPAPIPMLPREIDMEVFDNSPETQEMYNNLQIPIGFDKESTNIFGFNPVKYGYFVVMDDTPQQTEFLEAILLKAFEKFKGRAKRIVFDMDDRFTDCTDNFDLMVSAVKASTAMTDIVGEMDRRLRSVGEYEPMFVYIPDVHIINDKLMLATSTLDSLLKNASKVNIHFIFHGHQNTIENRYEEFHKRLRANMPAGTLGTRFMEQNMVKGKTNYQETLLDVDEILLFMNREIYRIKLPRN